MKNLIFLLLAFTCLTANAQTSEPPPHNSIGLELDVLPYITGGYYGSVWFSHDHFRYRAVVTDVTTPDFFVKEGFTNNRIMVYTLLADYFFQPAVKKWWVGTGFEYWDATIQTDEKLSTAAYENFVFTIGGGYIWKFYKNFYLNPWAAFHMRIAGDKSVMVDDQEFKPAFFTPEGSLKVGWYFNLK